MSGGKFDPMHQFQIHTLVELPTVAGVNLSITNSVFYMIVAAVLMSAFLVLATRRAALVPGRWQSAAEMMVEGIEGLATGIMGEDGKRFFPFLFALFGFILACNYLGMFPYFFTATSQLAVTATLAVIAFSVVLIVGFKAHGLKFFQKFVPSGAPLAIMPLLIPIELISFLMRPFTLALRLFGNMMGGHIVLKVFAQFIIMLVAVGGLGYLGAGVALTGAVAITALEMLVSFLQAFVFTILTCIYLNDVLHIHH
jgi:F-type H+-transporting ATPase subunit a